jgi:hypothetical protein
MFSQGFIIPWEHDDFLAACLTSYLRTFFRWLRRKPNRLLSFNEVRQRLPCKEPHDAGRQIVPLDQVIGSVARCGEFDGSFFPRRLALSDRWLSISKAYDQDITLPPVELYKIGQAYFVNDGNHRVSVARTRGQAFIDAYVTEIATTAELAPDVEPRV